MPWFISIPLPGPFGWGKRLGKSKREKDAARAKQVDRAAGLVAGTEAAVEALGEWIDERNAAIDRSTERLAEWEASQREKQAATKARLDAWFAEKQAKIDAKRAARGR